MDQAHQPQPMGWWTISGEELIKALRRAYAGEEPDMVYAELYANSEVIRDHTEGGEEEER